MPIPIHIMRRLAYGRLKGMARRGFLNAIPNRVYYRVGKEQRGRIVLLGKRLGLPRSRLRDHFEKLKGDVRAEELGQRMVEDLELALELGVKTNLIGKNSSSRNRMAFKKNLRGRPLADVIEEMKQHAEAMPQTPQKEREAQTIKFPTAGKEGLQAAA